jgi:hypothetical protein
LNGLLFGVINWVGVKLILLWNEVSAACSTDLCPECLDFPLYQRLRRNVL